MSTLLIEGEEGFLKDEVFTMNPGERSVIGRSSSCDISIKECINDDDVSRQELEENKGFMSVSRKHATIVFHEPERVEVQDSSSNGTFLNGQRIEESTIDLKNQEHELRFGARETVLLSLIQFERGEDS